MNKTKINELIREEIISQNDRTIRSSIDSLNFLQNDTYRNELISIAKNKSTKAFYVLQSDLNDVYNDISGCTYKIPS